MICSLLISATGHSNAPFLSPATALFQGGHQIKNAASDFDEFLLAKIVEGEDSHLRPIENYWVALRQAMYAGRPGGYPAKHRINVVICEIDQQVINLFSSIKDSIFKSTADGPYSLLNLQMNLYYSI